MKIFYDYQIFYNQRFGGPSRYFVELYKNIIKLNKDVKIFSPININHHLKDLNISKIQKGIFLKSSCRILLSILYSILFSQANSKTMLSLKISLNNLAKETEINGSIS